MAEPPMTMKVRLRSAIAIAFGWLLSCSHPAGAEETWAVAETANGGEEYRFVCDNDGRGLSVTDVLEATGEHGIFLSLFSQYDPEGFAILSDPELADKTVWAPTDAAFSEVSGTLSSLSDTEIKAILGYHITPPRRTPEGPYPIITLRFLTDGGQVVHQTRTGILTSSDQRVRTRVNDGVLTVESSRILPTSWCTQTGSVFSISTVIMDAPVASVVDRVIFLVLFKYLYLSLFVLGAVVVGSLLYLRKYRAPNLRVAHHNTEDLQG